MFSNHTNTETCTELDQFFEANYFHLLKFCQVRWNGSGEDVLHQSYLILRERYSHINFPLFAITAHEAARALGLCRTRELPLYDIPQPQQKEKEDPQMERLQDVLAQNHVDAEEVLLNKYMMNKIQAEMFGQLPLFEREEGR